MINETSRSVVDEHDEVDPFALDTPDEDAIFGATGADLPADLDFYVKIDPDLERDLDENGGLDDMLGDVDELQRVARVLGRRARYTRRSAENSRKIGRPCAIVPSTGTFGMFEALGRERLLWREAAEVLGCAESTLRRFRRDYPEAEAAFRQGWAAGRLHPRRRTLRAAMRGNVAALIFLGVVMLGQKADDFETRRIVRRWRTFEKLWGAQ